MKPSLVLVFSLCLQLLLRGMHVSAYETGCMYGTHSRQSPKGSERILFSASLYVRIKPLLEPGHCVA